MVLGHRRKRTTNHLESIVNKISWFNWSHCVDNAVALGHNPHRRSWDVPWYPIATSCLAEVVTLRTKQDRAHGNSLVDHHWVMPWSALSISTWTLQVVQLLSSIPIPAVTCRNVRIGVLEDLVLLLCSMSSRREYASTSLNLWTPRITERNQLWWTIRRTRVASVRLHSGRSRSQLVYCFASEQVQLVAAHVIQGVSRLVSEFTFITSSCGCTPSSGSQAVTFRLPI
jgi:hypothetical protein